MESEHQKVRTGKKKRKSKGGLIQGQPAKPQVAAATASSSSASSKAKASDGDLKQKKKQLVNDEPVGKRSKLAQSSGKEDMPKKKKQQLFEDEPEESEDDAVADDADEDDEFPIADDDDDDEDGGGDDDDEENFVDADAAEKKSKKKESVASSGAKKKSVLGGKRNNEFQFELEVLQVRKLSELPTGVPSTDDDDNRGQSMLEWLLAPMSVEQFFEEFWERKPLLIKRHSVAPNFLKGFYHRSDINAMLERKPAIASSSSQQSDEEDANVDLGGLRFTYDFDVTSYTNGQRQTHNLEGRATVQQINDFFDKKKCSIRILRPQKYLDKMWQVLSALEEGFQCVVGANSYLTPANSQGFSPHYDDIEAFVLQTEGAKRWRLYAPPLAADVLGRVSSHNYEQSAIGKPFADVVLETGDMLYFPRGVVHQAMCQGDLHSLHVTISTAQHNAFADYLSDLVRVGVQMAAAEHLPLRRSVPRHLGQFMGFVNSDREDERREDFQDQIVQYIGAVAQMLPYDVAADLRMREFIRERLPPFLSQAEKDSSYGGSSFAKQMKAGVDERTRVRFLRGDCVRLIFEAELAVLYHSFDNLRGYREHEEQSIEFGPDFGPALEYLLESFPEYVEVGSLPELESEDAIELVTTLLESGLMRFE